MKLKNNPIEIDSQNPFDKDLLDRQSEIKNLSLLISNIQSPAVLSINSRWGTGKTTFIKMWEAYLVSQDTLCLYFNAWETDFSVDPLVAFLGEMNDYLDTLFSDSDESKEIWSTAKKVGSQIARRTIPALIKVATVGVIDAEDLIEDEAANLLKSLSEDALSAYESQKEAIKQFKTSLSKLFVDVKYPYPIVIFIDELDRCRPDYAISLLERIKHLFDIEGIIFVLALDKFQLEHSVRSVYGQDLDAIGYLRRFIDFEYSLRLPEVDKYIDFLFSSLSIKKLLKRRWEKYPDKFKPEEEDLKNTFTILSNAHNLTLREVEQFCSRLSLILCATKDDEYIYPQLLIFLIVTKEIRTDIYERYIDSRETETEILDFFDSLFPPHVKLDSNLCAYIEASLIAGKNWRSSSRRNFHEKFINKKNEEYLLEKLSPHDQKQWTYSLSVLSPFTHHEPNLTNVPLNDLVKKLDLVSQFNFSDIKD